MLNYGESTVGFLISSTKCIPAGDSILFLNTGIEENASTKFRDYTSSRIVKFNQKIYRKYIQGRPIKHIYLFYFTKKESNKNKIAFGIKIY